MSNTTTLYAITPLQPWNKLCQAECSIGPPLVPLSGLHARLHTLRAHVSHGITGHVALLQHRTTVAQFVQQFRPLRSCEQMFDLRDVKKLHYTMLERCAKSCPYHDCQISHEFSTLYKSVRVLV